MISSTHLQLLVLLLLSLCSSRRLTVVAEMQRGSGYAEGSLVPLYVNSLTSTHTLLPLDAYNDFAFCRPDDLQQLNQNLGEFLTGNKIQTSPYEIHMLRELYCQELCRVTLDQTAADRLQELVSNGYHHNWNLDGLPSAALSRPGTSGEMKKRWNGGFPVGFLVDSTTKSDNEKAYLFNHVNIRVQYGSDPMSSDESNYKILGFTVEPLSIDRTLNAVCLDGQHMQWEDIREAQVIEADQEIVFTYDVMFEYEDSSSFPWSSRWEAYLTEDHLVPDHVHLFSIFNSIVFAAIFLGTVVYIIRGTAGHSRPESYQPLASSSNIALEDEDEQDQSVLPQAPQVYPVLFCAFLGSGVQLLLSALITITIYALGLVSPATRGLLVLLSLTIYMFLGCAAGYTSSQCLKSFQVGHWRQCTFLTAVLFPGVASLVFVCENATMWLQGAVHVSLSHLIMLSLFPVGSILFTYVGAKYGYAQKELSMPDDVDLSMWKRMPTGLFCRLCCDVFGLLFVGLMTWATIYVEFFFSLTSLWMGEYYATFLFLLVVALLAVLTCGSLVILAVFTQLCAGRKRVWWHSFLCGGSVGAFVFIYSISWAQTLELTKDAAFVIYSGYMALISFGLSLAFGSVGVFSTLWFLRKVGKESSTAHEESPRFEMT